MVKEHGHALVMPNGPPDNTTPSPGKRVLSSVEGSKDGTIDPLIETFRKITKSCNIAQRQSSVAQRNIVNNAILMYSKTESDHLRHLRKLPPDPF